MPRLHAIAARFVFVFLPLVTAVPESAAEQPLQPTFRFDIRAGSLDSAITAFENVSGIEVIAPEHATLDGLASPGLSATCSAQEGLRQLLLGTGLTFRLTTAKTYSLEIVPHSETVEVSGQAPYGGETSVAATRTLTPLRQVPQAVTVITERMMADQLMTGMSDVARYVPGVGMAQGEGNRDTPILRGNSTTGDFFVDGLRDDVQYYRDLYNVERVEVLKGPNAMIFGRGGAGGVINRATRQADWSTTREVDVQGGSYDHRRATLDIARPVSRALAVRMTGMYENSGSYRDSVSLDRYGLNPTVAIALPGATLLRLGYERFHDERTADRGIPSMGGRPVSTAPSTFFGDPGLSQTRVTVDSLSAGFDRTLGARVLVRNRTRYASYDKFYQNVYPSGPVTIDGSMVPLGAYNNATARRNLFNQTDVTFSLTRGGMKHVLLTGAELGRQVTDNLRNTGYFTARGPDVRSMAVPVASPTVSSPVRFQPTANDADNHGVATLIAIYAQDQLQLPANFQAIGGLRYDRFEVQFRNNRQRTSVSSEDGLLSPRVGLIYSPASTLSVYTSYSLAYVPRAGDQLSSLSLTNHSLEPEKFTNYEIGLKWDARPDFSVTGAWYRLKRGNVIVPDPLDITHSLLVDGQRTEGVEIGVSGSLTSAWRVLAGYAYQDGRITSTLAPGTPAGSSLAQLPRHSFSVWSRYDFARSWGAGLGMIHNDDKFTSTDNTVVLPAFTRLDGALFVTFSRTVRAQVNIENVLDERYFSASNGNNNISPGAPRTARVSVTTRF